MKIKTKLWQKERGIAEIVLAGNPNTGKSTLFNHLTGLGAICGNWPGKTVEIMQGKLKTKQSNLMVTDLPGTYGLSDTTEDEKVAKDYILQKKPDIVVNIIDATILERNLFLTLQLLSLKRPMIVALNFHEEAEDRGCFMDEKKLAKILGVPVIKIDALRGAGIIELSNIINKILQKKVKFSFLQTPLNHSERLEHKKAKEICQQVMKKVGKAKVLFSNRLDRLATEPLSGSFILILVLAVLFITLFWGGGFLEELIVIIFNKTLGPLFTWLINLIPQVNVREVLHFTFVLGLQAGLAIAIPYITVFYILLAVLEDVGYLPRMAYLLDRMMHKIGLHGKSVIPMILGFGCNVPAILATRILPTKRERILTATLVTLIPCSARTAIILGATGHYLGWVYALLIYLVVLILIFLVGYILGKRLPGEKAGFILEMPEFRMFSLKNVFKKTWIRLKDFVNVAFPILIVGSGVLGLIKTLGLLEPLLWPLKPIISQWLMLPKEAGITLVYGVLRKEMALETLIALGGTTNILAFMAPLQIFIFSLVVTIYIPCVATFGVLKHEFGWKNSILIGAITVFLAILAGGVIGRLFLWLKILS